MGERQPFHPRRQGCLGRHRAGGMLPGEGQLRLPVGEGGFVDQQVRAAGQLHRRLAEHGVGAVHHAAARPLRSAELPAVDHPPIGQGHPPAGLQFGVDRPRRNAEGAGPLHIEAARPGPAVHPVGVGRHPVGQAGAAHGEVVVVEQELTAAGRFSHPMDAQRIADPGGGGAQHPLKVVAQGVRPIQIHAGAGARQPEAGQQARQSEDVVAVHVGDEDPAQLAHPQFAAQELVLGGLAAVEQPELAALGQPQRHRRDIAGAGRHA